MARRKSRPQAKSKPQPKELFVVLRSVRARARDVFVGPYALPMDAESTRVTVEVEGIDRRQLSTLTRDSDVVAVAPSMRMKLIEPVRVAAAAAAAGASWGIGAVGADTSPFDGDGIVVAVLDTGIDATHPAFQGVNLTERDFTGDGNGDQHGHGTHCAGTIFGRSTGGMRIGVATGVKKALIGKVIGNEGGASEQIASAMQWAAENGANVISMSLGIDFPGFVAALVSSGLKTQPATSRALEAYRANVMLFERLASLLRAQANFGTATLITAAAGNESDRSGTPAFEIAVSPPAVAEGIVSVAAVGQGPGGLRVADFSNTGANVAAPGVAIISAKPGGGFATMSGTSMATPHVAGVAALWAQKITSTGILTPVALTSRLIGSATRDGLAQGTDPFDVGEGLVRAPQS
jgi:subtilisin family serine protease